MATKLRKVYVEDVFSFRSDVYCDNLREAEYKLKQLEGILEVHNSTVCLIVRPDPKYNRKELIQDIVNLLSKE